MWKILFHYVGRNECQMDQSEAKTRKQECY